MNAIKRGQISVEYLIVITFVTMVIITTLGVAMYYQSEIQNAMKFIQLERFAKKIIFVAEKINYAGDSAKETITAYLPIGVTSVEINSNLLIFNVSTQSGQTRIAYSANAQLNGTLSSTNGVKRITLTADGTQVNLHD